MSILAWLKGRRDNDRDEQGKYIGRHKTQLESIESVLGGSADALHKEAGAIKITLTPGEVYRRCRQVEEAAAWLQRVWEFYRQRFDQRDELTGASVGTVVVPPAGAAAGNDQQPLPPLGPTVRAADEVVWSAYHGVMKAAAGRTKVDHGPAPLPFVAPEYSPAAIDSRRPLAQHLRLYLDFPTFDPKLKALVSRLAVPLLVLPPWSVNAPWWLIFIVHEVGHHLTRQLDLLLHFAEAIDQSVKQGAGLPAATNTRWRAWHDEIAADAWSIALVGPVAAEALAEVEMGTPEDLRTIYKDNKYPPAVIRLALMERLSKKLGLGVPTLPAEFKLAAHEAAAPAIKELAGQLDFVVNGITGPLPNNLGDLKTLAAIETSAKAVKLINSITFWQQSILAAPLAQAKTDEAARHVSAGVFRAWHDSASTASPGAYAVEANDLAKAALAVFGGAGADGERGASQPNGEAPELATELTTLLMALSEGRAPDLRGNAPN